MNIWFLIKRKRNSAIKWLTTLWYDNFGENQDPLQRNGMAAIQKITHQKVIKTFIKDCKVKTHLESVVALSHETLVTKDFLIYFYNQSKTRLKGMFKNQISSK